MPCVERLAKIVSQETLNQQLHHLQSDHLLTPELIFLFIDSYDVIIDALGALRSTLLNTPLFTAMLIKHPESIQTVTHHVDLFEHIIHAQEQGDIPSINPDELYLFVDAVDELTAQLHYREYRYSSVSANDVYYMKQAKQVRDIVYVNPTQRLWLIIAPLLLTILKQLPMSYLTQCMEKCY